MRCGRRLSMMLLTFVLLSLTVLSQDWSKFEVSTVDLGGGVAMLRTAGGNIAAFTHDDGLLVVDSEYEEVWEQVSTALAIDSRGPMRHVVNTHWHFDHVGGNAGLAGKGAVIIAHENVRTRMAAGQVIGILETVVEPMPTAALPSLTFDHRLVLHLGEEEVVIFHPPAAHTDGDSVVHFREANVIHAGDIWFHGGLPFIDISSGGTIDGMIGAVEQILALSDEDTRIIPGHGPAGRAPDLQEYLRMMQQYRRQIATEAAAGMELEEVIASDSTAALDEKYGRVYFSPAQFKEMVFRSLP
jgi:cyclase